MTRNRNVADVQSNGISAVPPSTAGKNAIINGGFDIWQRGTSFANPASYFADRWTTAGPSAGVNNMTLSRETTGVPAGSQYLLRLTSTGATSYSSVNQFIETANVVPLQGRTVTYSFKVRRNATFSNSGILVIINKSSTVDAGTGGTYSGTLAYVSIPLASIPTTAATSTATYYNASVTFDVPNDGTCNSLYVQLAYNGAVASGSILEYSQMQLEIGSTATPFSRNASTIQGELAACQRYCVAYGKNSGDTTLANALSGMGTTTSTTSYLVGYYHPIKMRAIPTLTYSGTSNHRGAAGLIANTGAALGIGTSSQIANVEFTVASGLTANQWAMARQDSSGTGSILFEAEL